MQDEFFQAIHRALLANSVASIQQEMPFTGCALINDLGHMYTERLMEHLTHLPDRQLVAESDWEAELDCYLNSASFVLLLINQNFLASNASYEANLQRAIQCHDDNKARVIPILLRVSDLGGVSGVKRLMRLRDYQAVPFFSLLSHNVQIFPISKLLSPQYRDTQKLLTIFQKRLNRWWYTWSFIWNCICVYLYSCCVMTLTLIKRHGRLQSLLCKPMNILPTKSYGKLCDLLCDFADILPIKSPRRFFVESFFVIPMVRRPDAFSVNRGCSIPVVSWIRSSHWRDKYE